MIIIYFFHIYQFRQVIVIFELRIFHNFIMKIIINSFINY